MGTKGKASKGNAVRLTGTHTPEFSILGITEKCTGVVIVSPKQFPHSTGQGSSQVTLVFGPFWAKKNIEQKKFKKWRNLGSFVNIQDKISWNYEAEKKSEMKVYLI